MISSARNQPFKNGVVVRGMFDEIEHLNAAELARLFVVTMG